MKKLLTLLLITLTIFTHGQTTTISRNSVTAGFLINFSSDQPLQPCGAVKSNPAYYTKWEDVDTLNRRMVSDTGRDWVEDEERILVSPYVHANYCPCGCLEPTQWEQWRVCRITGIRQRRMKIQTYYREPPPKSNYQTVVDSLNHR